MSYSICNVLTEAGISNIQQWVPFDVDEADLRNRLRNKMIRPTTIPHTLEDLRIEQAVAREALLLAFAHHKSLARTLKGIQTVRSVGDLLTQEATGQTLVKMMNLDMIVGSGGVLSHAPRNAESAFMMLDAYQPEGITMLAKDSIFMMPQLGVLSTVHPEAAAQVFDRDCLIKFGHCICPVGASKPGNTVCTVEMDGDRKTITYGTVTLIPLGLGETKEITINPTRGFDVGAGRGKTVTTTVEGGTVGLIIDARGRPLVLPADKKQRIPKLQEWHAALGLQAAEE
jgi:hypothetical protein